jgi:conjugal transfer mating pair stabilization protein TraN
MFDWFGSNDHRSTVTVENCTYYRASIGSGRDVNPNGVYRICESEGRCLREKYEQFCVTSDDCAALEAEEACVVEEAACLNYNGFGCRQEQIEYKCENIGSEFSGATLTGSRIDRVSDVLVNECDPDPETNGCASTGSECTAGAEVRIVNGFPVSRECWEYKQSYQCVGDGTKDYSDCAPFKNDSSCRVTKQTCLSFAEAEETTGAIPSECVHWEYEYTCGGTYEIPDSCSAFNVCVGDLCEGFEDAPNGDFANASAWLTVLDEAAKDSEKSIDGGNVTLFSGTARKCKVGALGTINCCKDSGWANDTLADCSENELALMDRIQAKAAVYVGTYCSRKVLGVCLQRKRSYCTFNSQLGMVFQKEIRRLSGTGWGSAKNPNCAGLALEDINTIDWDQIDLSEAFTDMLNEASVPTSTMVTDYLRDRLNLTAGALSEGD